ncbi:MAG: hypothetical protein K8T91_07280 [Planctomycetes bacterium]|nr:hypothetical protein [Planctomycetota bacterium]
MTSRLFRVDMSEGSRDFVAVATEPGLAMLDASGANYGILRRWFGPLVAEPELQTPELVSFYVREPERGRLENLHCHSVSLKDLRGPLKSDLDTIEAAIRKAKPESSNERLLHKIVAKTFKEQTADLEKSDFDCYFFKYRQPGGAWKLVWCWGYQRRDLEPSRAVICTNPECHRLFAHRPKTKRRCPNCQTIAVRKRGASMIGTWPLALLLFVIALALLGILAVLEPRIWPWRGDTLVVRPESVEMAEGERRDVEVTSTALKDVTAKSTDPAIVTLIGTNTLSARKPGQADIVFTLGKQTHTVHVNVAAAKYKQVEIRPAKIALKIGESLPFDVLGTTVNGREVRLGADQFTFLQQPLATHVELDRDKMQLRGLKATDGPMPLEVQLAGVPSAKAEISVAGAATTGTTGTTTGTAVAIEEPWGVYPPVAIRRPGTVVSAGSQLGGPLRFVPGQGLIADGVTAGSPLALAGVLPGSTISHVGGTDISHYSPAQLADWLAKNPIVDGTVLGLVGPDGKRREVRLGIDARVLLPVQVLGIKPSNVSAGAFDAAVKIQVRDRAEYRIVDDKMHELGPWTTHGPAAEATIQITQIPRSAGRNEYDMYVERRLAGDIKRYPFVISLSASPQ